MNATKELFEALDQLEKLKGIPKAYMLEKVTAALTSAFKKEFGSESVKIVLDPEKKKFKVYRQKRIVEVVENPKEEISLEEAKERSRRNILGGVVEEEVKTDAFGRLSAQAGKQVIIQAIREAETLHMVKEYEKKSEEVVTATVVKSADDTGAIVIDTGTSEAVLIKKEQIKDETFEVGDRIKVFITSIKKVGQEGPIVTLSRTHPGLVKRLFELEIPEIQDGTVVIKSIAREAGSRTKIAVWSRDENVDAVGSCIGEHGMRINTIISELNGEKIDIIEYSESPEKFIAAALSPAEVISVDLYEDKNARITVANDQLSLAIGKEGQNARLAARLTGYKIDIKGI